LRYHHATVPTSRPRSALVARRPTADADLVGHDFRTVGRRGDHGSVGCLCAPVVLV